MGGMSAAGFMGGALLPHRTTRASQNCFVPSVAPVTLRRLICGQRSVRVVNAGVNGGRSATSAVPGTVGVNAVPLLYCMRGKKGKYGYQSKAVG